MALINSQSIESLREQAALTPPKLERLSVANRVIRETMIELDGEGYAQLGVSLQLEMTDIVQRVLVMDDLEMCLAIALTDSALKGTRPTRQTGPVRTLAYDATLDGRLQIEKMKAHGLAVVILPEHSQHTEPYAAIKPALAEEMLLAMHMNGNRRSIVDRYQLQSARDITNNATAKLLSLTVDGTARTV